MSKIDVRGSRELQAVIFAMKKAGKELRTSIYAETRRILGQEWTFALYERAQTPLEHRVLVQGARIRVGTQGFTVTAAKSRKPLRGGLKPVESWHAVEFGANPRQATIDATSKKGRSFQVTKTINTQLRRRNRQGYVVMPAARNIGHRLVALWVQLVVREYRDAFERRG